MILRFEFYEFGIEEENFKNKNKNRGPNGLAKKQDRDPNFWTKTQKIIRKL